MKKYVNGELVDMTAEVISEHETLNTQVKAEIKAEEDAKIEKDNLKVSARQKLINGEPLTEDEAKTVVL